MVYHGITWQLFRWDLDSYPDESLEKHINKQTLIHLKCQVMEKNISNFGDEFD